jgi:hypothetical protein
MTYGVMPLAMLQGRANFFMDDSKSQFLSLTPDAFSRVKGRSPVSLSKKNMGTIPESI